ncbi:Pro-Pol polyprotein [Operophtera brumata]|uniref:Pro-Pol polyprotein n=1 Tax=Operophtera brumata TaxID=104452 RepID=A0A0L7LJ73_OPEBR|nr:Pro-Pol polyprotein [Operophtera brumata]
MGLQASLIDARLATEIIKSHQENTEVILWSDSKTVLHWIRKDLARYAPYVAHQLSEIAELTRPEQWRWIPMAHNVVDDATRSGKTQMLSSDRWFVGPAFLYENEDRWPVEIESDQEPDEALVTYAKEKSPLVDISRFSSYERLIRTVAYALTFIDKCRRRANELNIKHIKQAERLLIRDAQQESFSGDLERLKNGKNIDRSSRLYKLDPKLAADGIIRLNSRTNAATLPAPNDTPANPSGT